MISIFRVHYIIAQTNTTPIQWILNIFLSYDRSNGTKRAEVWVDDEDEVKALKTVVAIANQKPLTPDENTKATKALFEKLVGVRRKVNKQNHISHQISDCQQRGKTYFRHFQQ